MLRLDMLIAKNQDLLFQEGIDNLIEATDSFTRILFSL